MIVLLDVLFIILLFFLFALLHSWLAATKVKKKLIIKYPGIGAFYRIFYNLLALLTFLFIFWISPEPDVIIYDLSFPFDIIIVILQILSLLGLIWSVFYIDVREFLGLKQIKRFFNGTYNPETLDEVSELNTSGPYRFSRHPLYLFTILFLALRPAMDLSYFTFIICFIVYFYVGAYFEEQKLVDKFGDEYKQYKKNVPSIFPFKFIK